MVTCSQCNMDKPLGGICIECGYLCEYHTYTHFTKYGTCKKNKEKVAAEEFYMNLGKENNKQGE